MGINARRGGKRGCRAGSDQEPQGTEIVLGMDGGFCRTAVRPIRIPPRLFELQLAEANTVVVSKTLLILIRIQTVIPSEVK